MLYQFDNDDGFLIRISEEDKNVTNGYTFHVVKNKNDLTFEDIEYGVFDLSNDFDLARYARGSDIIPVNFSSKMSWVILEFSFKEAYEDGTIWQDLENRLQEIKV